MPFWICSGNHDHYGNYTGEIEYSKHSTRWNYPDKWYTFSASAGSKSVQFISIDTVLAAGNVADQEDPEA